MKRKQKKLNILESVDQLVDIEDAGHIVERFTDYHWRIDHFYDVWPSGKKFMKMDGFFKVKNYVNLKDIFL